MTSKKDPRVTKRRVTMRSVTLTLEGGREVVRTMEAVDFVRPDVLDAYVEDAQRRWQLVTVSDEPDAGPGGYDAATTIPFGTVSAKTDSAGRPTGEHEFHPFPHPLAGSYFPATDCKDCDHAPAHPLDGVLDNFKGVKARTVTEV